MIARSVLHPARSPLESSVGSLPELVLPHRQSQTGTFHPNDTQFFLRECGMPRPCYDEHEEKASLSCKEAQLRKNQNPDRMIDQLLLLPNFPPETRIFFLIQLQQLSPN
jgi:hypothetical protein